MIRQNKKSSETTREILLTQFNFENYIKFGTPKHKPNPDISFLEWFIGFFEAEGFFCHWFDGKRDRVQIEINQKDPKLMYKIKMHLGFGNVTKYIKNNKIYWRYQTSNYKNLHRFIYLFNGNWITTHKFKMFSEFIQNFNQIYNTKIIVFEKRVKPSLYTSWLSGFLEGDGGFWAQQFNDSKRKKLNSGLKIKFFLTQKNELNLLKQIKILLNIQTKIYQITNGHSFFLYNRLETSQLRSLQILINYLNKYPFKGQRNILIVRWSRLIRYKINNYPMSPKSIKKLQRLIESTKNN